MESTEKLMRKGTRSCRECRRRKVKCIYAVGKSICQECATHSRRCQSQGYVRGANPHQNVTQAKISIRVAKLESVIERLARDQLHHSDEDSPSNESSSMTSRSDTSKTPSIANLGELDKHTRQESPVFRLFQNQMLQQDKGKVYEVPSTESVVRFSRLDLSDREKVLSPIANEPNIFDVLNCSGEWWLSWRHQPWASRDVGPDLGPQPTLVKYVQVQLKSDNPVVVAIGMMCLAMALEQLRPGTDDTHLHLSSTPKTLEDQILAVIDQVVLSNDHYLASDDGVLLLLMRGKHHVEGNQLRKAWLRIRQAIFAAQQVDFTKASQISSDSPESLARQRFLGSVFELDRMLSMVLGLPYAVDENFNDRLAVRTLAQSGETDLKMRAIRRIAAVAAGRVNDRNAQHHPSIDVTKSIQQSLDAAYASMPEQWWNVQTHLANDEKALEAHDHLMTQYWFWNVQTFLNLPYMLEATPDSNDDQRRQGCLLGARKMLEVFNVFRLNVRLNVFTCNCEDFQGLLAASILLLGFLQDASYRNLLGAHYDQDLALVEETEDIFAYRAQQKGGSISKQGLKVLEQLSSFFHDDDPGSNLQKPVILPYFGTIFITWNEDMPRPSHFKSSFKKEKSAVEHQHPGNIHAQQLHSTHTDAQHLFDQSSLSAMAANPLLWDPIPEDRDLAAQFGQELNDMDFNMFDQDIAIDWNQFLLNNAGQDSSNAYYIEPQVPIQPVYGLEM